MLRVTVCARQGSVSRALGSALFRPLSTGSGPRIHYTHTDEAPMLATYALLPIIRRFTNPAGIAVEKIDISVAARVLAQFPERLTPAQRVKDTLGELGEIVKGPGANIIKLPNISASVPQRVRAPPRLPPHRSTPACVLRAAPPCAASRGPSRACRRR